MDSSIMNNYEITFGKMNFQSNAKDSGVFMMRSIYNCVQYRENEFRQSDIPFIRIYMAY
jgi:hypothetical protein